MQRWKFAVGAVVLTLAVGPITGCSKSGGAKQTATQAKGKTDPKAAKSGKPADKSAAAPAAAQKGAASNAAAKPATNAAKQGTPAQKPAATAANTKAAAPAAKPSATTQSAPTASKTAAPATKPDAKPAQTAAATKPATASKAPATSASAQPTPAPATAKPAAAAAPATASTVQVSGDMQQELQSNKVLMAQIQPRFPAGTDVVKASLGFRNLQQFVSAVHASHNLGVPFEKFRSAMVDEKKSLSQAIRVLKPTASATIEAQRADYDARGTIYQAKQAASAAAAESTAKKPAKPSAKPKASSN